jgi:hypothetical protein
MVIREQSLKCLSSIHDLKPTAKQEKQNQNGEKKTDSTNGQQKSNRFLFSNSNFFPQLSPKVVFGYNFEEVTFII